MICAISVAGSTNAAQAAIRRKEVSEFMVVSWSGGRSERSLWVESCVTLYKYQCIVLLTLKTWCLP